MPTAARIRSIKGLHVLGDWIYASNLWHLNRYSASMAFLVGLFVAFLPMPGQTVLAAAGAVMLRCNLPLSVGLVFLTNPLTMPPLFYMAYKIGALILGVPAEHTEFELSSYWLSSSMSAVWKPFLLGCLVCGLCFGCVGYVTVSQLWRLHVVRNWQRRQRRRAKKTSDPG